MDTGQIERTIGGANGDTIFYSHNAYVSMDDIVHSMRGHLLDQHAHASPDRTIEPEFHHDKRFSVSFEMKRNKENIDPMKDNNFERKCANIEMGQEEWLQNGKQCKVPPLNLGDPGEDTETEIELNTPRLNNPLFQKLKKKYPRAFRRRSSAFSDTSSVCSLSLPGTPHKPRRFSLPPRAQDNGDNHVVNSDGIKNTDMDDTFDNNSFEHSMEDLTISGCSPLRNKPTNPDHSFTKAFAMNSNDHFQSTPRPLAVSPKRSSGGRHETQQDSKLSLKERLQRNKKNLRELLDEKYPFKNRSLSVFSGTPPSSQHDERSKLNSSKTNVFSANHIPVCASKPPKPNHHAASRKLTNGNLSLHDIEHKTGAETLRQGRTVQKRSVTEQLDQKQLFSKRFSSPDSAGSTHDSAVDVDSASLQSSPSSSDHNHSPDQNTTQRMSQTNTPLPPRPVRYAPKLKSRRSTPQNSEADQFSLPNRDSDTDSGIGAHSYHTLNDRNRNDSGSSVEAEIERTGMFSGRKLSPKSMREIQTGGHRMYGSNNSSPRQGPVKADHNIHTPSPTHKYKRDEADEEVEMWYKQGARPKVHLADPPARRAFSVTDFTRRRESPSNRVHFNDDVDYSDKLQPWHRTVSHPDLTSSGAVHFQFSLSPEEGNNSEYDGALYEPDLHGPGRPFSSRKENRSSDRSTLDFSHESSAAWDNTSQSNFSTASGPELAHEIGYYSKLYEDINSTGKTKKFKRPWRRNKAKFTPSDDDEKVFSNLVKARSASNIAQSTEYLNRTDATNDVYENIPSLPDHNDTYENIPSLIRHGGADENPYEEVSHIKKRMPPSKPPRPQKKQDHDYGLYASVDKKNRDTKKKMYSSNPCITQEIDESIDVVEAPPVPSRGYTNDLEKYKDLSGSRSSLSERMGSMKKSAKEGLSRLRRAISLEKVDKSGDEGQGELKKSSSIQSLKDKLPFRRKGSDGGGAKQRPSSAKSSRPPRPGSGNKIKKKHSSSMTALDSVDSPTHFRPIGKLLQLNPDGSQVLELNKPPHGPFGFYIARGNAKYNHGIFISRLSDSLPASFFASLLGVGDEILEINQREVRSLTMEQIHEMMASNNRLILKTLPFLARKDV